MARTNERQNFKLVEMPNYVYPINLACPECYRPLESRKGKDGRCEDCLKSKEILPINYRRTRKKKTEDDEDEYSYSEEY